MLQGDLLSVILFILCFNPLSYLLKKCDGYTMGPSRERNLEITHLFFVDDLKLYSVNENKLKIQLDVITSFSNDIGMQFGEDKCAYIYIERGKRKSLGKNIQINEVKIRELEEEESYKYLGLDESVQFENAINKENIITEYSRRLRKIWSSELNAFNKILATNTFAVPVVTYSYGLLNWTKENIRSLDTKTRKIMNINNSLNQRSDVDRLYVTRKEGGRGLISLEDQYLARIVANNAHHQCEQTRNPFLHKALKSNNEKIGDVANKICESLDIDLQDKSQAKSVKEKIQTIRKTRWHAKPNHGYFEKSRSEKLDNIDYKLSWAWMQLDSLSSQVEGYIITLQDQEIYTKTARKRHEKDPVKKQEIDTRCRMCKQEDETLQHILDCCPAISSNLYLQDRHNPIAKIMYDEY